MPEYTPTTEEVRTTYAVALFAREHGPDEHVHDSVSDGDAEFDRWLARVKADAAAQALEDFADEQWGVIRPGRPRFHDELCVRERALAYRKEQTDA